MTGPLEGLLVLDLSQYLAGPSAALRLADLGAEVVKVERPGGDGSRGLALAGRYLDGDPLLFHTINRGKAGVVADLRDPGDREAVLRLVDRADVLVENNRPGASARLGLDADTLLRRNPRLVHASVTGYGTEGPWRLLPGQDLLLQALTGIVHLNGTADRPPTPLPFSVVDTTAGAHLVEGVLACLVRRTTTGRGGRVEVSLLESALSLQFEGITTHLASGRPPRRSPVDNAVPLLAAPYGIYPAADGHLAIAMGPLDAVGRALDEPQLVAAHAAGEGFSHRDALKEVIRGRTRGLGVADCLERLRAQGLWCAPVLTWEQLRREAGYRALDLEIEIARGTERFTTTACPLRIDGHRPGTRRPAPRLGEHTAAYLAPAGAGERS